MGTTEEELDGRGADEQAESGGRRGRSGLSSRLRRGRGSGTDVAEPTPEREPDPEPMTQPVSASEADGWFSFVKPVEYDEWGDPIVEGVPRGPNTVGLRRAYFPREDESSP